MADFHTDYENYSKEDEERYFKICDLEKKLLKEIDTSQPLALWEVQKHFTSVIESMYHQELEEIQTRYRKYQPWHLFMQRKTPTSNHVDSKLIL